MGWHNFSRREHCMVFEESVISTFIDSAASGVIVGAMCIATLRANILGLSQELKEFKISTRNELKTIHDRMWDGQKRRESDNESS